MRGVKPKVGDPMVVVPQWKHGLPAEHGTVSRVGRTLFDVTIPSGGKWADRVYSMTVAFWHETGGQAAPARCFTPEEWAVKPERDSLVLKLNRFRGWARLPIESLRQVAALIEEEGS